MPTYSDSDTLVPPLPRCFGLATASVVALAAAGEGEDRRAVFVSATEVGLIGLPPRQQPKLAVQQKELELSLGTEDPLRHLITSRALVGLTDTSSAGGPERVRVAEEAFEVAHALAKVPEGV